LSFQESFHGERYANLCPHRVIGRAPVQYPTRMLSSLPAPVAAIRANGEIVLGREDRPTRKKSNALRACNGL